MKECYWCKKQCPLDEEGSFELDIETKEEIGWICDHCVLAFDGKCECEECTTNKEEADKALWKYDLSHRSMAAYICLAIPLWLGLILYILWSSS